MDDDKHFVERFQKFWQLILCIITLIHFSYFILHASV